MALKKVAVSFALLIALLSACQHASETRPTDAEIQRFLPGVWRLDASRSNDDFPPLIAFKDRNIYTIQTTMTQFNGIWFVTNSCLILHSSTNTPESEWHYAASFQGTGRDFPIIAIGTNEFVSTPGISVAGRLYFNRIGQPPK